MVSAVINPQYNSSILNVDHAEQNIIEETQFDYIIVRNNRKAPSQNTSSLAQWFAKSEFVTNLNFSTIPADKVFQRGRFNLKFKLTDKYNPYFPLLRGLFQFRKPHGLTISADRFDKSFLIEFTSDNEEKSIAFFATIFHWLSKEVRFKEVLKEVIRFEQKISREQTLLLSALQSAVK